MNRVVYQQKNWTVSVRTVWLPDNLEDMEKEWEMGWQFRLLFDLETGILAVI